MATGDTIKTRKDDGARYFGPFKSRSAARATVDLINAYFPLRTCPRTFKTARSYGSPCLQLDLRRCLGPCVGRADRDEYMEIVRSVVRFLDGDDDLVYQKIWAGLEEAAERLDFERALGSATIFARCGVSSRCINRSSKRPRKHPLALPSVFENCLDVLLVVEGQLWSRLGISRREEIEPVVERLDNSWIA